MDEVIQNQKPQSRLPVKNIAFLTACGLLLAVILFIILIRLLPGTTGGEVAQSTPPVQYDVKRQEQLLSIVSDREVLNEEDTLIRSQIKQGVDPENEIVIDLPTVTIEYVASPDVFQGAIKTTEVNEAKEDAVAWFEEQGISREGICKLPLFFYLTAEAAENLSKTKIIFDPLPTQC